MDEISFDLCHSTKYSAKKYHSTKYKNSRDVNTI